MKRLLLLLFYPIFFVSQINGDGSMPNQIYIEQKPKGGTHFVSPPTPADMPQVYYDSEAGVITVDGTGDASYYYVDIVSQSTLSVVLYDTVDGDYGTVDVSSLPDDNYQIIITSSHNNEYTGYFTNY